MTKNILIRNIENFLLISGPMRTGTTLMGELLYSRFHNLQRHPYICFANDNVTDIRKLSKLLRYSSNKEISITDPITDIPFDKKIISSFYKNNNSSIKKPNINDFKKILLEKILTQAPVQLPPKVIGLKTTHLLKEIDILRRLFKNVKFILLARDPRDMFCSNLFRSMKQLQNKKVTHRNSIHIAYLVIVGALNTFLYYLNHNDDKDLMIIKYEDLVMNTNEILNKVFQFLSLDSQQYNWKSIRKGLIASNSSYYKGDAYHIKLNANITTKSIGIYKKKLTPFEIYFIEKLTMPILNHFDYDISQNQQNNTFDETIRKICIPKLKELCRKNDTSTAGLDYFNEDL